LWRGGLKSKRYDGGSSDGWRVYSRVGERLEVLHVWFVHVHSSTMYDNATNNQQLTNIFRYKHTYAEFYVLLGKRNRDLASI